MTALLRALLLRNRYCAPVGPDGELPGGGADEDVDDDQQDVDTGDGEENTSGAGDGEEEGGDLVVSLGTDPAEDDEAEEDAIAAALDEGTPQNAAFAKLRVRNKEFKRKLAQKDAESSELRRQLQAAAPAPAVATVGPKPQAKDYEMWEPEQADKFEADLLAWTERKAQVDAEQAARTAAQQQEHQRWQTRIGAVDTASAGLKVRDQPEAVTAFSTTFTPVQQLMILGGPTDPKDAALLRYALGANPAAAKKLAGITDMAAFAFEAARLLHKELNVATRGKTPPPPPERRLRAAVAGAAAVDNNLVRLEAEAEKTGNRDKVLAYKRQQKAKQAA